MPDFNAPARPCLSHAGLWRMLVSLLLACCLSAGAQAAPGKRLALVVGNAAYEDAPLKNPVNDATDLSARLRQLGFEVTTLTNRNRSQLTAAIRDFGRAAAGADAALFYFAGHGVQVRGRNYLLPVGQKFREEADVETDAVDVNAVLARLEEANAKVSLLILDACRSNPLQRSGRASTRGLARMEAPSGALVAFAAQPGAEAQDGDGRNGVFTKHLLAHMGAPGVPVELMLKRVRADVERETGRRQSPREESSLTADFYFVDSAPGRVVAAVSPLPVPVPVPLPLPPTGRAFRIGYVNKDDLAKRLQQAAGDVPLNAATRALAQSMGLDMVFYDAVYARDAVNFTKAIERQLVDRAAPPVRPANHPDLPRIGYVNSERVLKESQLAKAAQQRLEAEFQPRERTLAAGASTARQAFQEDLARRKAEELEKVVAEANRHIRRLFDAGGFDLIVQEVIFSSSAVDVTGDVIDLMDGRTSQPVARAQAAPSLKVAFVDAERVLREAPLAKEALRRLEAEFEPRRRALGANPSPNDKQRVDADIKRRRDEETAKVVEAANKYLKSLFQTGGYDLMLQDPQNFSDQLDVTNQVIAALR